MTPLAVLMLQLFTFFPNAGFVAGGQTVQITAADAGIDFTTGTPEVTFGGVPATSVTVVDSKHLNVQTPPHGEGAVKVTLRVNGTTSTSDAYFGFLRARETLLIPVASETAGAFGTRWTTDIWFTTTPPRPSRSRRTSAFRSAPTFRAPAHWWSSRTQH